MKPYSAETRTTFLQLRARGTSLGAISAQLSVPKSTLCDWDKQLADEIARLRALEWEAIEEQFGRNLEQDLRNMAERIRKWEARVDRMNPDHFNIRQVLALLRETRCEYFRRRAILMAPLERPSRSCSKHPDESARFSILSELQPRNTNHLQQPPSESSGSTSDIRRGARVSNDFRTPTNDRLLSPLPWGEGQGEGQTITLPSAVPTSVNAAPALNHISDSSSASPRLCGEPPDTYTPEDNNIQSPDDQSTDASAPALPLPRAASRRVGIDENDDPKLGWGEEQTSPLPSPAPTSANAAPALNHNSDSSSASPRLCGEPSKIPNPKSEIDENDSLGSIVISPFECGTAVVLKTTEQEALHRKTRLAELTSKPHVPNLRP